MRRSALVLGAVGLACAAAGFAVGRLAHTGHAKAHALTPRQWVQLASAQRARRGDQSFLFSQDAAGGSLAGPDDQHLTLRLTGVRDWVTRFADRPEHDAATVDIRDFLDRWHARYEDSPPNAVLSYRVGASSQPRDMVLELRRPAYDAKTRTATYAARRITRTADRLPGTKHPRPPVKYPIPKSFGPASLFIDDATCSIQLGNPKAGGTYILEFDMGGPMTCAEAGDLYQSVVEVCSPWYSSGSGQDPPANCATSTHAFSERIDFEDGALVQFTGGCDTAQQQLLEPALVDCSAQARLRNGDVFSVESGFSAQVG